MKNAAYKFILAKLEEEHSRQQSIKIAAYIGDEKQRFEALMQLMLGQNQMISQRASWAFRFATEARPELASPYLDALVDQLQLPAHDAARRNALHFLGRIDIPENLQGKAVDTCFRLLSDAATAPAIQVYAMTVIHNISKHEPGLQNELELVLQRLTGLGGAAVRSRGGKSWQRYEKKRVKLRPLQLSASDRANNARSRIR